MVLEGWSISLPVCPAYSFAPLRNKCSSYIFPCSLGLGNPCKASRTVIQGLFAGGNIPYRDFRRSFCKEDCAKSDGEGEALFMKNEQGRALTYLHPSLRSIWTSKFAHIPIYNKGEPHRFSFFSLNVNQPYPSIIQALHIIILSHNQSEI